MTDDYKQTNAFDKNSMNNAASAKDGQRICLHQSEQSCSGEFFTYDLEKYKKDIETFGLEKTWESILSFLLSGLQSQFLAIDKLAELYEIGLALQDKGAKKEKGQYYTPDDVAAVMAVWFNELPGENICDVACGTGILILTYLNLIGFERARDILKNGNVYLYDNDKTALAICKTILVCKYGADVSESIHAICCDFLRKDTVLPENCKVICNPPYATVNKIPSAWENTAVTDSTKELYAIFMEKILNQSRCSVIITPYSFLGGSKFISLREEMNAHKGFVVSFDNVPGNVFCGKKHGVFNTNTANSVRAAITVVEEANDVKGFRMSPLIRFKNEERSKLFKNDILESFVDNTYQITNDVYPMYRRCFKSLCDVWNKWMSAGKKTLDSYLVQDGKYTLSMPNTCRYFTVAANGKMKRNGQIILSFNDKHIFNYVFCLINSSFAYWYWRNYDGGITYPKSLLLGMPLFYDGLTNNDKRFFDNLADDMIRCADKFVVTKNNIGVQENIKYPKEYRDKINRKLLDILGSDIDEKEFDVIHSNMALEVKV